MRQLGQLIAELGGLVAVILIMIGMFKGIAYNHPATHYDIFIATTCLACLLQNKK